MIFLDTEFTKLDHSDLISLALVAEDGREFYAERNDFDPKQCSEFVRQTVLPLLGRVPGAACSRMDLTHRLRDWVGKFSEPPTFVFDSEKDWHLLAVAMLGRPQKKPPGDFGKPLYLDSAVFSEPTFRRGADEAYTQELSIHHALADARALMAGYRAWMDSV